LGSLYQPGVIRHPALRVRLLVHTLVLLVLGCNKQVIVLAVPVVMFSIYPREIVMLVMCHIVKLVLALDNVLYVRPDTFYQDLIVLHVQNIVLRVLVLTNVSYVKMDTSLLLFLEIVTDSVIQLVSLVMGLQTINVTVALMDGFLFLALTSVNNVIHYVLLVQMVVPVIVSNVRQALFLQSAAKLPAERLATQYVLRVRYPTRIFARLVILGGTLIMPQALVKSVLSLARIVMLMRVRNASMVSFRLVVTVVIDAIISAINV